MPGIVEPANRLLFDKPVISIAFVTMAVGYTVIDPHNPRLPPGTDHKENVSQFKKSE